jgi:hypothetical protein
MTLPTSVVGKLPDELGKLELWELGRRKLGYGDWDPENPVPYRKWSGLESHKLFLVMRKRKITNSEFLLCVDYCQRHHKRIENAIWVFKFIGEAKGEQKVLKSQHAETELGRSVEQALAYERTINDDQTEEWIGKLTRARGHYREEALREWDAARKP